ncbi:unnamed protein product, partial [Ectocarpus sp. 12 AP-2014]
MSSIADNIGSVTRRIQKATLRAGRASDSVRLLAVSKTRTANELREAVAAGQTAFGENYLQEALDKQAALADLEGIDWHFIDRLKIARRLSEQRDVHMPPLNICLQVNINEEDSKAGCTVAELDGLVAEIGDLPNLALRGLMAIPDPDQPESALRASFRALANALKSLRQNHPDAGPLDTLSMG